MLYSDANVAATHLCTCSQSQNIYIIMSRYKVALESVHLFFARGRILEPGTDGTHSQQIQLLLVVALSLLIHDAAAPSHVLQDVNDEYCQALHSQRRDSTVGVGGPIPVSSNNEIPSSYR
ncbi:a2.1 [Ichnoviriform fugitivi]|uniref:A2.1 n=1 Tax=Ichnoviriform fugitivi TaxID=265522 RepID=A2Q0C8_9VIRU|nr:a2.1 [Ichnoviriform fugitivi]BAF45643.1 a2.1 [Ichnoviriform fugitivi]